MTTPLPQSWDEQEAAEDLLAHHARGNRRITVAGGDSAYRRWVASAVSLEEVVGEQGR